MAFAQKRSLSDEWQYAEPNRRLAHI